VIRLNGSDTYFCNLDYRMVKWKNKFHEKRALQKLMHCLPCRKFTADKTNEIFNIKNIYNYTQPIDVASFKGMMKYKQYPIPFCILKSHSKKDY
jgi:hypothetical protein